MNRGVGTATTLDLERIVSLFDDSKRAGRNSFMVRCPCHNDDKQSLHITLKGGRILLHDFGGCSYQKIMESVGLSAADLGNPEKEKPTWMDTIVWSMSKKYGEGVKLIDEYRYTDEKGVYQYSKVRFSGGIIKKKEIRYITVSGDTFHWSKAADRKPYLYNLRPLLQALDKSFPVYIVEGEKDVETMRKLNLTATTAGGVKDWKPEYARYFKGAKVTILSDNDQPGKELAEQIKKDLRYYAGAIRIVTLSDQEHGDVTDYLESGHTPDELHQAINAVPYTSAHWINVNEKTRKQSVNADLLAANFSLVADYVMVQRPDDDRMDFYLYKAGAYRKINSHLIKGSLKQFIPLGIATDSALNNAKGLLLASGRNMVPFDELDRDERYINFRNGLLDLETMEMKPHNPKVLSTIQLNCDYDGSKQSAPVFEKYINDLCRVENGEIDQSKKDILQEFFGLAISNVYAYRTKAALALVSYQGNSGKSRFLDLINRVLGAENIAAIPIQAMNEQSKFTVGTIAGKRCVVVGDQGRAEVEDSSLFRSLTGGDVVKVEAKGKQPFYLTFRGAILFAANDLPIFKDDKGGHMFERLVIVPCSHHVPKGDRDPLIVEKMVPEIPAIVNWAILGLKRLIQNGHQFTKSTASEEASTDLRLRSDTIFRCLNGFFEITGNQTDRIKRASFHAFYREWCRMNGFRDANAQNIPKRMESLGIGTTRTRFCGVDGAKIYTGIKPKFVDIEKYGNFCDEDLVVDFHDLNVGNNYGTKTAMTVILREIDTDQEMKEQSDAASASK